MFQISVMFLLIHMLCTYYYCSLVHVIFAYFGPSEQFLDVSSGTIVKITIFTKNSSRQENIKLTIK